MTITTSLHIVSFLFVNDHATRIFRNCLALWLKDSFKNAIVLILNYSRVFSPFICFVFIAKLKLILIVPSILSIELFNQNQYHHLTAFTEKSACLTAWSEKRKGTYNLFRQDGSGMYTVLFCQKCFLLYVKQNSLPP